MAASGTIRNVVRRAEKVSPSRSETPSFKVWGEKGVCYETNEFSMDGDLIKLIGFSVIFIDRIPILILFSYKKALLQLSLQLQNNKQFEHYKRRIL